MATWRADWYPNLVTAFRGLRGDGGIGSDGVAIPLLQASDGIAVLMQVSPGLVSALTRLSAGNGDYRGKAVRSEITEDGSVVELALKVLDASDDATFISIQNYVSGVGYPGAAAHRSLKIGGETYTLFLVHDWVTGDEFDLLGFARGAMYSWQRAVDAAALMLSNAALASDTADPDAVAALLAAVRSLAADLDVLQENPPMTRADKIKGAARAALDSTQEFAGKAAAQLGEEIGRAAGNVAKGFFDQAGFTSLVVAGLAVHLVLT